MGYYIQAPTNKNKALYLINSLSGKEIKQPSSFSDIPAGKALIVVVDNGPFEACGLAYNEREFKVFTSPTDYRPKRFILLDKQLAYNEAGYEEKVSNV